MRSGRCLPMFTTKRNMGVSKNNGTPKSPNHQFVHRVFHYIHHPFWGTIIFGSTPTCHEHDLLDMIMAQNYWTHKVDLPKLNSANFVLFFCLPGLAKAILI